MALNDRYRVVKAIHNRVDYSQEYGLNIGDILYVGEIQPIDESDDFAKALGITHYELLYFNGKDTGIETNPCGSMGWCELVK